MFDASGNPIALVLPTAQREGRRRRRRRRRRGRPRRRRRCRRRCRRRRCARRRADGARAADGDDGRWRQLYRLEGDAERQRLRAAAAERGGLVLQSDWKGGGAPRATEGAQGAWRQERKYLESAGEINGGNAWVNALLSSGPRRPEALSPLLPAAPKPPPSPPSRATLRQRAARAAAAHETSDAPALLAALKRAAVHAHWEERWALRDVSLWAPAELAAWLHSRPQREALETALRLATSSSARAALIDLQRAVASYGRLAKHADQLLAKSAAALRRAEVAAPGATRGLLELPPLVALEAMVEPSSRLLASLRLSVTAAASPARVADSRDTSALVVGPALSAAADDDDGTLQRALGELHAAAEAWRRGRLGALYAHDWAGRPTGMHTAGAAAAEGDSLGGLQAWLPAAVQALAAGLRAVRPEAVDDLCTLSPLEAAEALAIPAMATELVQVLGRPPNVSAAVRLGGSYADGDGDESEAGRRLARLASCLRKAEARVGEGGAPTRRRSARPSAQRVQEARWRGDVKASTARANRWGGGAAECSARRSSTPFDRLCATGRSHSPLRLRRNPTSSLLSSA